MKKYLALISCLLFVLGSASSAFAIHATIPSETQAVVAKGKTQITIGGSIRFRGEYRDNITDQLDDDDAGDIGVAAIDDHQAFYDGRVRLNVDARLADNVNGFVQIEATGTNYNQDTYRWGANSGGGGLYPMGESKRGDFHMTQAWILYTKGIYGIKIGHMPLKLGYGLFFDHTKYNDDAIVLFADPNKNLHLSLLTIKFNEGTIGLNDDADAYVALFNWKGKNYNVSGDVTYVDDQANGFDTFGNVSGANEGTELINFGLRGDVTFNVLGNGLTIRGDVEIQTGESEEISSAGVVDDVDLEGYAFLLGADYKIGATTITLEGAYGSGDEDNDMTGTPDEDFEGFIPAITAGSKHYTYVYDYRTITAAGTNTMNRTNSGLSNTTYVKFGAKSKLAKKISGEAYVYWLQASEDVQLANRDDDEDDIGWEVDAKVTYQIAKNLKYWVEGGILFTGDMYDYVGEDADDAFAVRNGIMLSF